MGLSVASRWISNFARLNRGISTIMFTVWGKLSGRETKYLGGRSHLSEKPLSLLCEIDLRLDGARGHSYHNIYIVEKAQYLLATTGALYVMVPVDPQATF